MTSPEHGGPNRGGPGHGGPDRGAPDQGAGQRIDRWLWHARFARTRTAAQTLAESGHVRINREKVHSASRRLRAGDVLTIAFSQGVRVVRVRGFSERRLGASATAGLYEEIPASSSALPSGE
jgi:ribosome-associated heat shock protein Hsp15